MPIDATPFIDITPRGHRPRIGKEPRVPFTTATVDPKTLALLNGIATGLDISRGVMLDHLASFAVKHGFVADYLATQKKKTPAMTTTSLAGAFQLAKPHSAAPTRSVKSKPVSSSRHVQN